MRFVLAAFLAVAAFASSSVSAAAVTTLDSKSFNSFLAANDVALVEFFAPWCGHCKKLAPEYETAAAELASANIPLAAVDCTTDKDLCTQHDVTGFPTLKIFHGPTARPVDYGGGRTAPEIVKYMKKHVEPAFTVANNAAELEKAANGIADGALLIGVFPSSDTDDAKAFIQSANVFRSDHSFVLVTDDKLVHKYAPTATSPCVVLLKKDEVTPSGPLASVISTGPFTETALATFIKSESFPLVGVIGPENFQKYVERGYPLVWMFVDDASPLTAPALAVAREVAATVKTLLSIVQLDGIKWAEHAKHFGLKAGELPGIVLEDRENSKNYLFPFSTDITVDALSNFFSSYAAGTLAANVKSQEIPSDNNGPVTTLVGKNFDAIVMDDTKDVLVEFYAPWCGHCKSLAPKYEALGKMFADNDKVIIAQIDATENDTPAKIKGFPTLILYKAGDKSNPITYEGERTENALAVWLRVNGGTFADAAAAATTPAAADHDDHAGHSHDDL